MKRCRVLKHIGFMVSGIFILGALVFSPASAQDFPRKPIRFIVPFSPGGAADTLGRIIGDKLTEAWAQQVVIDNRPGAGGNLAAQLAAQSSPDGYTIIIVGPSFAVNVSLYTEPGYDPIRDFSPITQLASAQSFLVVNSSVPVRSVKELIALAKAKPGQLNYGSAGSGSPSYLAAELFKTLADVKLVHVPYKGAGSTLGLLRGDTSLQFSNLMTVGALVKTGKVRVLAVCGSKRSAAMPEVPTIAEAGVPGYKVVQWYGVLAPAGTPMPIVSKLNAEIVRILSKPDVMRRLENLGTEPVGSSPQQFKTLVKSEITKWAKLIKSTGMRVD